jgi:hypothetical protein
MNRWLPDETQKGPSTKHFAKYISDPVGFCSDVLGLNLWRRQKEILLAALAHKAVAVRSGHKVGKTTVVAALALWWCSTRANALVILTSSSYTQVDEQLWPQVRKLHSQALRRGCPLGGRICQTAEGGIKWPGGRRMFGMSTDKSERMGGYSGDELLFVVDEASGIDESIYEAIEGNMAGGARKILVGNPTQIGGTFYDAFHADCGQWHTIHVSSEETPNVAAGKTVVRGLATLEWIEGRRLAWGENDPRFAVRVRGDFPAQGANSVISLQTVESAIARWNDVEAKGHLEIGVDVARFGDDDSVITPRRGNKAFRSVVVHGQDTLQVVGWVLKVARGLRVRGEIPRVKVDGIGVGSGVVDVLRSHAGEVDVDDVNVAEAATCEEYSNLRAQIWFGLNDWLKDGGAIPSDTILKAELVTPTYKFDARGRLAIERKEDMKKRIQRSPDRSDSLALAVYSPAQSPRGVGNQSLGLY